MIQSLPVNIAPPRRDAAWVALLAAFLAAWGISWGLPSAERALRVFPPETATPRFLAHLADTWRQRQADFGAEPMLSKGLWTLGFEREATVEPGWTTPPPVLENSSRSFLVRSAFEDESNMLIAVARIKPHRLEFNPRLYTGYGAAYFMTLGAWMALVSLMTPLRLVRDFAFYLARPDQMWWLYLSARLSGVFLHALIAALVAGIGARFWGRRAGLWAGLFFAVAPANVMLAHILKPRALGTAWLCGLFYFCARIAEARDEDRRADWLWAGAMLGMAAAATNLLWDAGVLLLATLWLRREGAFRPRARDLSRFAQAMALSIALFFVLNPFFLIEGRPAWHMMFLSKNHADLHFAQIGRLVFGGLPKGLPLTLELWLAAALLTPALWASPAGFLAAVAALFYIAIAFSMQDARLLVNLRHFYGLPFVCWLAGAAVARAAEGRWRRPAHAAAVLSVAAALWLSAVIDLNFHRETGAGSTKDLAGAWIERNIPAGAEIGMIKLPQPGNCAYFRLDRYRLRFVEVQLLAQEQVAGPEYLVLTALSKEHEDALAPLLRARYSLVHEERPVLTRPFGPPARELFGNPPVYIFRKSA